MKKLFILAVMAIISSAAFAQLGAPLTVAKGDARYTKITDLFTPTSFDTVLVTGKATAPTKAAGTNTNDVATMAALQAENEAWSSGFLNFTGNVGMPVAWASYMLQHSLTDGFLKIVAVKVTKPCTATGVKWIQSVAGDYTADNYNGVVLFSISGTTYTKIAESTNDGNIWKATSNTVGSKAFSSPVGLVPGVYYVGVIYNQSAVTTAPQIAHNDFFSAFQSFTGSNNFCQRVAASTVSASYTLANFSVNNEQPFVTLY